MFFSLQFYGPRIGAIYTRNPSKDTPVYPILYGGGQERNFRPGYVGFVYRVVEIVYVYNYVNTRDI